MFNYSILPKNILTTFNADVNLTVITKQKTQFRLDSFQDAPACFDFQNLQRSSNRRDRESVCMASLSVERLHASVKYGELWGALQGWEGEEGKKKKVSDSLRREAAAQQSRSVHVAFQPLCVYVYTHIYTHTHIHTYRRTQSVLLSCSGTHWRRQHSNREEFTSAL